MSTQNKDAYDFIAKTLTELGLDPRSSLWKCQNVWVVYHWALEKAAAAAGIQFDQPQIITSEKNYVTICVTGRKGDKVEWSIGEVQEGNYKALGNNKMQPYPWAMAEKRAKDRVILKLLNISEAKSEDESDEFSAPVNAKREIKDAMFDHKESLTEMQSAWAAEDYTYMFQLWREIPEDDRSLLWIAPTKAKAQGLPVILTTEMREFMKNNASQY